MRTIAVSIVGHVVLVVLTTIFLAIAASLSGAWHGRGISATLTLPAWLVLLIVLISIVSAVITFTSSRRASVVRGRGDATKVNVTLMASREAMPQRDREVRSTRFGSWPPNEYLPNRTNFRQQLDQAILHEETLVHRIWNVSSAADAERLREMITKYRGRHNHSIRAYFELPDHVLPEVLVVTKQGASISFSSTSRQQSLDSVILFKRLDLIQVINNYFEVLWDGAERILQGGQLVHQGDMALKKFEEKFATNRPSP